MNVPYFGPDWARKPFEVLIPTPVGEICLWCEEEVEEGDMGTMQAVVGAAGSSVRPIHHECSMRSVIGSVAHVEGRCSCFVPGALEGDDPRLTRRQAARAALDAFNRSQAAQPGQL